MVIIIPQIKILDFYSVCGTHFWAHLLEQHKVHGNVAFVVLRHFGRQQGAQGGLIAGRRVDGRVLRGRVHERREQVGLRLNHRLHWHHALNEEGIFRGGFTKDADSLGCTFIMCCTSQTLPGTLVCHVVVCNCYIAVVGRGSRHQLAAPF